MKRAVLPFFLLLPFISGAYTTPAIRQAEALKPERPAFNALPCLRKVPVEDREKAAKAWEIIRNWQADGKPDNRKLHVVYVTIRDRPPLKDYKERQDRIAKNIQAFYFDQMEANGFPPLTFALDLDANGKLIVHDAHLDTALGEISKPALGTPTRKAAEEVLIKAGIDPKRDYMLVVCQIPDGQGPYYGTGSHLSGCCWTCDAEHIDPLNFTSDEKGDYRFGPKGNDTTVYIGGTAHELGHCFSLPHTMSLERKREAGSSIMASGNYEYGKELRGEKGSFLIQSDALRLASIPLFSGKEKSIENPEKAIFSDFSTEKIGDGFTLKGRVAGSPPVYGVVAYFDPAGGSDYDASSATAVPESDGSFSLSLRRPGFTGLFELRLVALHADGSTVTQSFTLNKYDTGVDLSPIEEAAHFETVRSNWKAGNTGKALQALAALKESAHEENGAFRQACRNWELVLKVKWQPPKNAVPADLSDDVKTLNLADATPKAVESAWASAYWDSLNPHTGTNTPWPIIKGASVERFIYTHAPGSFTYDLGGKWTKLTATLASPGQSHTASIIAVFADGKEVYKTKLLSPGDSENVSLDLTGVSALEIKGLIPEGKGNRNAFSIVANGVLER